MFGSGRCILQPYEYRTPNDETSAVRTLGLGVCCVLSMDKLPDAAGNEIRFNVTVNPQVDLYCRKLREDELISTFCKTRFDLTPLTDHSGWEQKVQAALGRLDFISSAVSEHQDELRACVLQVESAVREANLETKQTLTGTELITVEIVLGIMDQLDTVIAKRCPAAFTSDFRESKANIMRGCRASTNAPSYGPDIAWHRCAYLGAQASLPSRVSGHDGVKDQKAEVLSEIENVSETRCFSDDEQKILPQIVRMAINFEPLYPGVADRAELHRGSKKEGFSNQEMLHNTNTVSHAAYGHQRALSQLKTTHCNVGDAVGTGSRRRPSEKRRERCEAATSKHDRSLDVSPPPLSDAAGGALAEDLNAGNDDAKHETLRLAEKGVTCLVAAIEEAMSRLRGHGRGPRRIDVKEELRTLNAFLSLLDRKPLDPQALLVLSRMRSSLITARTAIDSRQDIRLSNLYMARLNKAIIIISRLWHQTRLAELEGVDALQPQELESLREVTNSAKEFSPMRCIASTAYAALLKTDREAEAEQVLDDCLTFLDLANKSIDLSTAQLYLLILLHIRHDNVKLLKPKTQESLDKLIVTLRDKIFEAGKSEISIREFLEFKNFTLTHFGASTRKGFDWRDSLRGDPTLASDRQRPLITKLFQYGASFCEGLDQLTRLPHEEGSFAIQARSLKAFRSRLLRINPPECVFVDDQMLAYLERFAAFAEKCLNECQGDGSATGHQQLQVLGVTLDCLQWCRLLSSYLGLTSPSTLEEAYDMTAKALILNQLWSSPPTASMFNSERAFISKGILSALKSNKLDDELLACTKMYFDQKVPSRFVANIFDELLLDRSKHNSDYDTMVTLLALECRIQLFKGEIASKSGITRIPTSTMEKFIEVLVQARMLAKGVHTLPASDLTLTASLQNRFVASSTHEASRHLSVDVVLKEALKSTDPDQLTVGEVAYHVATYLLGNCTDERWLDFLTCQVKWCSFTPQHLAEHPDELMTLVKSLCSLFKTFWYQARRLQPLNSSAQATPNTIRHFVHTVTLKWLFGELMGTSLCSVNARESLNHALGEHVFGWMPLWLTLMYGRRALFPSGVFVTASLFEGLRIDVARQKSDVSMPASVDVPLDHDVVSAYLRRLLRAVGSGTLASQDLEVLLKQHVCPVLSRPNRNMFLTFLLWAWHHECLPVDIGVIERCIKHILYEGARPENKGRISVNTMQGCIQKLLASSSVMGYARPSM